MSTIEKVIFGVVVVAAFALMVFHGGKVEYRRGYNDALASFKPDTEYVEKKIYIDNPVPGEVTPAGKEMYPVGTVARLKRVIDSLAAIKPDTTLIEIPVPMETKLYRDERDSTYEAQVTGYHATLDWIKVNQKTAYITVPIPEYRYQTLIVSPVASVEVLPRSIFAGAGVVADYWTGRWQFSLEVGYGLNNILGPAVPGTDSCKGETAAGMYGRGQVKYNLIRK